MGVDTVRSPAHAGSWYDDDAAALERSFQGWLQAPPPLGPDKRILAIIGPHAGYSYCGHVLAYAYKNLDASRIKRVFLLGPSHHVFTRRCLLSPASVYRTPLGDIPIDAKVYEELRSTGSFDTARLSQDEDEHSLELHCPFLFHAMRGHTFTLVPIIVGAITYHSEELYGRILAPYLSDPSTLFAISSDFCHWGSRFQYQRFDKSKGAIHESIKALDHEGMAAIESGDPQRFEEYLQATGNTICGRHPIAVLLQALKIAGMHPDIAFGKYDQSSACTRLSDSSVSYASALVTLPA